MPKPLVPILVLAIAAWVVFLILLNYTAPFATDPASFDMLKAGYFLTALFSAVSFGSTLVFVFAEHLFSNSLHQKESIRRNLRRGFLVGLWVIGILLLKLSQTYHLLNLILLSAVLAAIEIVFRK